MSASNVLENKILDKVLGAVDFTPATNVEIALSTTDPTEDGSGITEPGDTYARVVVANNPTQWPAASLGSKSNGSSITFPLATGSWGTLAYFAIFDQGTGDLLFYGALSAPIVVGSGDQPNFGPGALVISAD